MKKELDFVKDSRIPARALNKFGNPTELPPDKKAGRYAKQGLFLQYQKTFCETCGKYTNEKPKVKRKGWKCKECKEKELNQ